MRPNDSERQFGGNDIHNETGGSMFKKLLAAVVLVGVLVMSGCASVPMASKSADVQAKQFAPAADKATVYIYRNESFGAAIKMPLLIDNVAVGDTASKTYVVKQLAPGSHTITSKTEKDSSITIDMLAGQIYYIWQEVKMGVFAARSELHVVDEQKGHAGVQESTLIE
jgi:PBP1b-binding outer membrane lipoprotein LpoB